MKIMLLRLIGLASGCRASQRCSLHQGRSVCRPPLQDEGVVNRKWFSYFVV